MSHLARRGEAPVVTTQALRRMLAWAVYPVRTVFVFRRVRCAINLEARYRLARASFPLSEGSVAGSPRAGFTALRGQGLSVIPRAATPTWILPHSYLPSSTLSRYCHRPGNLSPALACDACPQRGRGVRTNRPTRGPSDVGPETCAATSPSPWPEPRRRCHPCGPRRGSPGAPWPRRSRACTPTRCC